MTCWVELDARSRLGANFPLSEHDAGMHSVVATWIVIIASILLGFLVGRFWAIVAAGAFWLYLATHHSGIELEGGLSAGLRMLLAIGVALLILVGVLLRHAGLHFWRARRP
jgi:hypothetical protein